MTVDINELHRNFWDNRNTQIKALLAKPHIAAIVARREAEKAHFVNLSTSEAVRIERIRNQRSFELELESIAEEFSGLPVIKAQRRRAKRPRGKVADDGKTLNQLVETLVCRPEHRFSSAPDLWPHLFAELAQNSLEPDEISHGAGLKKFAYTYDFNGTRKAITYGRFANLVSEYRKKSR